MVVNKNLIFVLIIFVLAIVGGAFSYHVVEGWSLFDSFYFVVVTVTTIGYGDFVPRSFEGKLFTMFFAFFTIFKPFIQNLFLISIVFDAKPIWIKKSLTFCL